VAEQEALMGRWRALVLVALLLAACQAAPTAPARGGSASTGAAAARDSSAPAVAAPASSAAPAMLEKVTVAIVSPSEVFGVPWIGQATGIFVKHGFDVDVPLVTGSPRLVQSLIAGDFDYVMPGVSALVRARLQGADPVILATTTDYSNQNLVVHPRSGIHALPELRGKTVGVSQIGSDADTFLNIVLDKVGLKPDDVTVFQTGGHPQTLAALVSGNLDAGVLGGSNVLVAEQVGATKMASAREYGVYGASGALATTRSYLQRDRDKALRFMRAWVEAVHFYKTNREESLRILQERMSDLPMDQLAYLYDDAMQSLQPVPAPSEEGLQFVIDREDDPRAKSLKASELLDLSFLQEIQRSGFVDALYR
jgi:ABC-type nitrate/sulfonate/bicarbonate transport system substrate-binding protein